MGPQGEVIQRYELNRSRPEARCLINFDATAQQVCFPFVQQAARLTRFIDRSESKRPPQKPPEVETEWLLGSRPRATFSATMMFEADRRYWGIENGLCENWILPVSSSRSNMGKSVTQQKR